MSTALHKTVFSYAFRPFFLLIATQAVLVIAAWGLYQAGGFAWPDALPAHVRHGHEMLFGYVGGAIAGFLLTAVASWTGRPAVSGWPLMGVCLSWAVARVAAFVEAPWGYWAWGAASLLFWAALAGLMAREVIAVRNVRNYKVLPLLLAFLVTEAVFFGAAPDHLELLETCLRTGLFLVIGMISLVGGRIIPAFTQNWLKVSRPQVTTQLPTFNNFDLASVLISAAFAVAFIGWPMSVATGALGLAAALVQALRVLRWRGWLARQEPLLWILHVGYGWIPVGFALLGLSCLEWPQFFDPGIHALTYGAMGTLILGVAARVALGHTGRPLTSFPAMTVAFALITLGTLLRLLTPLGLGPAWPVALWIAAYGIFLAQYARILLTPRIQPA